MSQDYDAEIDAAVDEVCEELADTWEQIDRRNGIEPHDYSILRGGKYEGR
ncbi:MAG TPA: hypothetical protein VIX17_11695 [Pyrinomonadaceae bacterium]|jgi:hypothetical protein